MCVCSSSSPGVSSDTREPRARIPSFLTHDSDKYLRLVLFSPLSLFQSRPHCSKFTPGSVLEKWVSRPRGFCPVLATRWVWYQSFSHCEPIVPSIGAWEKFLSEVRCLETCITLVQNRWVEVSWINILIREIFAKSEAIELLWKKVLDTVLFSSLLSSSSFTFHIMKKPILSQLLSLCLCIFFFCWPHRSRRLLRSCLLRDDS